MRTVGHGVDDEPRPGGGGSRERELFTETTQTKRCVELALRGIAIGVDDDVFARPDAGTVGESHPVTIAENLRPQRDTGQRDGVGGSVPNLNPIRPTTALVGQTADVVGDDLRDFQRQTRNPNRK